MNHSLYDRSRLIELLQYYYFLYDVNLILFEKKVTKNTKIKEFFDLLSDHRYWQLCQVKDYLVALDDYIFWQSRKTYLKSMENFVAKKLSGLEFVNAVYYLLLADKRECRILQKDFKKQETLELNPESFQFSKIIKGLEIPLAIFSDDPDTDSTELNENQLRKIVKTELPKIQKYFTK